jgi:hypothetical protein
VRRAQQYCSAALARSLARVDYDEGDGGIKRRREQAASQPSHRRRHPEKYSNMAAATNAFKFQAHIFQSPLPLSPHSPTGISTIRMRANYINLELQKKF